jgi:hypothetical protein
MAMAHLGGTNHNPCQLELLTIQYMQPHDCDKLGNVEMQGEESRDAELLDLEEGVACN